MTIPIKYGGRRATLARFLDGGDLAYIDPGGVVAFADRSARRTTRSLIVRGQARAIRLATDRLGRWLAVGWDDHHIGLFEADTGSPRKDFDWDGGSNFVLSPDGKWLALQGPGPIHLVPTSPGGRAFDLPEGRSDHNALAFSPDGTRLAAAEDRTVLVWDLASRRKILTLSGHKEDIHSVAFCPDGTLIASCSTDATTRIWDAHDGRPITSIPGPSDMELVAFSPDGSHLAAAAQHGTVSLYQGCE
jgi:WD40 repeat protein